VRHVSTGNFFTLISCRVVPLRTSPTPSPRCRCPPRWSVAYDVRSYQEAARCPGDHLQHHDSARDPPQDLDLATDALYRSATPSRSTRCRREPKSDPLHAILAFLAAHVPSSPSRTPWLFGSVLPSPPDACACRTPWHQLHHLLRAQYAQWSFLIAGTAFIASSRAKCVSNK
jgi:hypothetical protein